MNTTVDRRPRDEAVCVGWTVGCCLLLLYGFHNWGAGGASPIAVAVVVLNTLVALLLLVALWLIRNLRLLMIAAMAMLSITTLGISAAQLSSTSSYATDSMAFNDFSAGLLLDGKNPYTEDLTPAFDAYGLPLTSHTLTLAGESVDRLSYPAGSFLFYAGAKALGLEVQTAPIVNVAAWLVALWLVFILLPYRYRWVALVFGAATEFASLAAAGLNDSLFLPFLLVAVWRWDRFNDLSLSPAARYAGPIALGLACSVKQTPWFAVPLLAVGVYMSVQDRRDGSRTLMRYMTCVAATFSLVNLPFILTTPAAWLRGITLPIREKLVVDGQGLVSFASIIGWGGGSVRLFTVGAAIGYLALVGAMIAYFPQMRRVWVPLLALVLTLPARSSAIYAAMWAPVFVLAAVTVRDVPPTTVTRRPSSVARTVTPGLAATMLGVLAVALLWKAPLRLEVLTAETDSQGRIRSLSVVVQNRTDDAKTPLITLNANGLPSEVWTVAGTRATLRIPANASRQFQLAPASPAGRPRESATFRVQAFTSQPETVSVSRLWGPVTSEFGKP